MVNFVTPNTSKQNITLEADNMAIETDSDTCKLNTISNMSYRIKKIQSNPHSILYVLCMAICAIVKEILSILVMIPLSLMSSLTLRNDDDTKVPIFCIHGYVYNGAIAWWWKAVDKISGHYHNMHSINLFGVIAIGKSLEYYSDKVVKQILKTNHPSGRCKFLTHSMGGLVATLVTEKLDMLRNEVTDEDKKKYEINDDTKIPEVDMIITIGSPLKGTFMANLSPDGWLDGTAGQAMKCKSKPIQHIKKLVIKYADKYRCIAGHMDECVPNKKSTLPSAVLRKSKEDNDNYFITNDAHISMSLNPQVIKKAFEWVDKYDKKHPYTYGPNMEIL